MASITPRGGRWRVQIRRVGQRPLFRTFRTRAQAQAWARQMETDLDAGRAPGSGSGPTVAELIQAYRDLREASRPIADQSNEHYMLEHLEFLLGNKRALTPHDLVLFARARKDAGAGPYTINMEVSKLGTVLRYAGAALHLELPDVVGRARPLLAHLGLIGGGGKRHRRPTEDELRRILEALPEHLADVVRFAIASCMRRGEIVRLTWGDVDWDKRLIRVRDRKHPRAKVGNDQWVPLLGEAWEIVVRLKQHRRAPGDAIFVHHAQTISKAFKVACDALGIADLHFHDLRHEGISRLFEAGYSIEQVALVSGHQSWAHLKRYTNLRPEDLHKPR